jgi:uncharacterized membrane protein
MLEPLDILRAIGRATWFVLKPILTVLSMILILGLLTYWLGGWGFLLGLVIIAITIVAYYDIQETIARRRRNGNFAAKQRIYDDTHK